MSLVRLQERPRLRNHLRADFRQGFPFVADLRFVIVQMGNEDEGVKGNIELDKTATSHFALPGTVSQTTYLYRLT